MKKLIFLLLSLLFIGSVSGQELTVFGFVLGQENNKQVRVPFATIYYYNYDDTAKVEFSAMTDLAGEYRLNNMQNGKYIVKVTAQGYETKRQEIQFTNVEGLANGNNGQVKAHIVLARANDTQIAPVVFPLKELVQTEEDTIEEIISRLRVKVAARSGSTGRKSYRIWLGGSEIAATTQYNSIKGVSATTVAQGNGDKKLEKSFIEFYDLSGNNKTLADGVINIVFNNKNKKTTDFLPRIQETTDFFINR